MTRRIAYVRADGGITISEIMPRSRFPGMTVAAYDAMQERVLADRMTRKGATKAVVLPEDWSPPDPSRDFRDAWELVVGDEIMVSMAKAREIHRDRLRRARQPLLEALDVSYQRADETDDRAGKTTIAGEKQTLRDITAAAEIDVAATPDDLRAAWPELLGPSPYTDRGRKGR